MNKLVQWLSALCDCFVTKSNVGGGAVGNVYGKRASELSLCDFAKTPITFCSISENSTGDAFSYVIPADGYVVAYGQKVDTFLGFRDNGMTVDGWLTLLRATQNNAACFLPVKKGQEISLHYTNSGGVVYGYFFAI